MRKWEHGKEAGDFLQSGLFSGFMGIRRLSGFPKFFPSFIKNPQVSPQVLKVGKNLGKSWENRDSERSGLLYEKRITKEDVM